MNSVYRLKADKNLVRDVYSAAKKLKLERVKQVCKDIYRTVHKIVSSVCIVVLHITAL